MMRTYRGIVCEKKNKYMVFLTEKGEFLRGVPIGDPPEIGEEADFTLVASSLRIGGKAKTRFAGAVLVAAALLFFIVSTFGPLNEKVMAYVQLDAGTAMEFGVNRKGNVISLRYLNEKPNELERLSGWKDNPLLTVLDMAILELSVHDRQINVTTIYPSRESEREARQLIGDTVQEVRGKHDALNLEIEESTPKEREVANKKKMSIHQFKSIKKENSFKGKQPAENKNPVEEKLTREQKDILQKTKKEIVPPVTPLQKGMEKKQERSNRSEEQQSPPMEKFDKMPNNGQIEKIPPHASKNSHPSSSPESNKHNQGNNGNKDHDNQGNEDDQDNQDNQDGQGTPAKQNKENPSNEKKHNPKSEK